MLLTKKKAHKINEKFSDRRSNRLALGIILCYRLALFFLSEIKRYSYLFFINVCRSKDFEIVNSLYLNGFTIIENFLNENEIEFIKSLSCQIERDFLDGNFKNPKNTSFNGSIRVWSLLEYDSYLSDKFYRSRRLLNIAKKFYGNKPILPFEGIYQKSLPQEDSDELPFGQRGWHFDGNKHTLKFFLLVENCDLENGPFAYIKSSALPLSLHKLNKIFRVFLGGGIPATYYSRSEALKYKLNKKGVPLIGKAGDVIIADTHGIHRAMLQKSGTRKVMVSYFKD